MTAVNIGISHNNHAMVAQSTNIESIANTNTHTFYKAKDLTIRVHFVKPRPFSV